MPSLAETLQANKKKLLTRGPNGQLSEESPEGVQQLAQNAGLPAPPTTPLGAAALGANPDQQKMMGTGQQKEAAIQIATDPNANLQTAVRQKQARTQQTAGEQQAYQKSQAMKDLGAMGDRVNDFINTQRQLLAEQAGQGVDVGEAESFEGKDVTTIAPLLAQLRKDPTNQDLMLQVNEALGYDINTQLDPAKIDSLYQDANAALAQGGAGVVADNLTATELTNNPAFGYDLPTLSALLGVDQAQLATMNISQIRDQVNKVTADEFSKSQELAAKAQSGELGQAERGEARALGREASATGVRASEADVNHLEQQIANADEVTFGGKSYNVENLLKDDTISNIISDYLNSGEDSQTRKDLEAKEPELVDFIKKNQAVLAEASGKLQAGAQTFQQTQETNKALGTVAGIKLPDELMSAILPSWGKLQSGVHSIYESPVLAQLDSLKAHPEQGNAAVAAQALATQSKKDPNFAKQLAALDQTDVHHLDLGTPGGRFDQYLATLDKNKAIQALQPGDTPGILNAAFGMDPGHAIGVYSKMKAADTLGFGKIPAGTLDPNDPQAALKYLQSGSAVPSLKDAADGNLNTAAQQKLAAPQLDAMQDRITNKLEAVASNGYLNYDSLHNLGPGNQLTPEEAAYMYKKANVDGNVKADIGALNHYKNDLTAQGTGDTLRNIQAKYDGSNYGNAQKFQELANTYYGGDGRYNLNDDMMKNEMANTAATVYVNSHGVNRNVAQYMFPGMLGANGLTAADFTKKLAALGIDDNGLDLAISDRTKKSTASSGKVTNDPKQVLDLFKSTMEQFNSLGGSLDDKLKQVADYLKSNFPKSDKSRWASGSFK